MNSTTNKFYFSILMLLFHVGAIAQVNFKADISKPGKEITDQLIGAFFEDINYAADGGLYAELIQNRSFEYYKVDRWVELGPYHAWYLIKNKGAKAQMDILRSEPINKNNTHYLQLEIEKAGLAGIKNTGFDGILLKKGSKYNYSVYIRSLKKFDAPVVIALTDEKGKTVASEEISVGTEWKKHEGTLTSAADVQKASLTLTTTGAGTLCFDMVSLFPEKTFKNRKNGLRPDLAQAIADIKPKFLRFPGGCIAHGRGLDNAYRWKETVGDVAERTPNYNTWGYHQTYGLGFFEYFQFSEDIGAMPLPVVPVGISCQFRDIEFAPIEDMQPWIDDALDLIEFANGDVKTKWGKLRAEMGHPAPFNMKYICLGNEEDDTPEFHERFRMIANAVRKKYPEIKIIGTSGTAADGNNYTKLWEYSRKEKVDAVDEHYYVDPSWLLANNHRYDNFDRKGPKVFVGEWASWGDRVENAIAEAAYLTGLERNGDVVEFSCYAPLFANENHNQWNPDMIRFDNNSLCKTPSYYVQQLFGMYDGNKYISSELKMEKNYDPYESIFEGRFGVGSWKTKAQYKDFELVVNSKADSEIFSLKPENWEVLNGTFAAEGDVYKQTSLDEKAWSIAKKPITASEYTLKLKAKRTEGDEGFLVVFGFKNTKDFYWLNLGGWNNTRHGVEKGHKTGKSTMISVEGTLKNDVWYDIEIKVNKSTAKVFLNGKELFDVPVPKEPVFASIVKNEERKQLIIKMANSLNNALDVKVNLKGGKIDQKAKVITLAGEPSQRNSLENPELVKPEETTLQVKNKFDCKLPANSFKVIVLNLEDIK